MYEKNDTSDSAPIINEVPDESEIMPGSTFNKKWFKILLVIILSLIIIGMITAIVLSIISFQQEKNEKKEEPQPPIPEKIFGANITGPISFSDIWGSKIFAISPNECAIVV